MVSPLIFSVGAKGAAEKMLKIPTLFKAGFLSCSSKFSCSSLTVLSHFIHIYIKDFFLHR